jgi:RNA polymerase sigma factor (sigma-70 family)
MTPSAVGAWCTAHTGRLAQTAQQAHVAPDLVWDALQELWVRVLCQPPPAEVVSDPDQLFAWLLVALRRRVSDLQRRECRRRHVSLDEAPPLPDATRSAAARRELGECVHRALTTIARQNAAAAQLLELCYLNGLSVAEVAQKLAVSPEIVSARLQRAKRLFRTVWRGGGGVTVKPPNQLFTGFRVIFARLVRLLPVGAHSLGELP